MLAPIASPLWLCGIDRRKTRYGRNREPPLRGVDDGMLQHSRAARRLIDFSHIQCHTVAFFRSAGAGAVATP